MFDLFLFRRDLDADHYGMEKLKRRVVEYLAVRQLKNTLKGPILCFVGPPGWAKLVLGSPLHTLLEERFIGKNTPKGCKNTINGPILCFVARPGG